MDNCKLGIHPKDYRLIIERDVSKGSWTLAIEATHCILIKL